MDKLLGVHGKKPTRKLTTKPKNKPVKVVYISNPVKVKTSVSEFMALVQELTGQDSVMPGPAGEFSEINHRVAGFPGGTKFSDYDDDNQYSTEVQRMEPAHTEVVVPKGFDVNFEPHDDDLLHQMVENFSGFLPSNLFYHEFPRVDAVSLDAV